MKVQFNARGLPRVIRRTAAPLRVSVERRSDDTVSIKPDRSETWWPWPPPDTGATLTRAAFDVHIDSPHRRITVSGELDIASAPVLADAMAELLARDPGDSTVDISAVSFIDAGGLGCLVGFDNRLSATGASLTVAGAAPGQRRIFGLVGLTGLLARDRATLGP